MSLIAIMEGVLFLLINLILKLWSGFFRKRSRKFAASSFLDLVSKCFNC